MFHTTLKAIPILLLFGLIFGQASPLYAQEQQAHKHTEAAAADAHSDEHPDENAEEHNKPAAVDELAHKHAGEHTQDAEVDEHGHAAGGHVDEVSLTRESMRQFGVVVDSVRPQSLSDTVTVPARVEFNREAMAHVGTPLEGRVADIKARLGDSFEKGDVLLVLHSPQFGEAQSAYLQKRSFLEAAKASVEIARIQFERAEKLREGGGINMTEFLERQGDLKKAESEVKVAEASLRADENRLHILGFSEEQLRSLEQTGEVGTSFEVRAPMSGKIVQREVTLGEVVGPDRDALLVIADTSTLWALADVPEIQAGRILKGAQAVVEVEALGGMKFPGTISYVHAELNRRSRSLQVRIDIADGNTPLHPGMFAQASIHLTSASASTALAIPDSAVLIVEGEPAVFAEVPDEPGVYARRPVKTGPGNGVFLPLLDGLKEGERIVVQGAFLLKAELAKGEMEGHTCSGH